MSSQRLPEHNWVSEMYDDLAYLGTAGALTGVAEIIRERVSQISQGWTPAHDREEHAGWYLMDRARNEAAEAVNGVFGRSEGPGFVERQMRRTGALAAAEIDRLVAEFGPQPEPEPAGYRCWHTDDGPGRNGVTHHVHGPDKPCPLGQL